MHLCRLPEQEPMLPWVSLLILATVSEPLATAHQSVIFLHPPWTTFFQGQTVIMICNGSHDYVGGKTQYYWYQRKKPQLITTENTLKVRDSGQYRCRAPGSVLSKAVTLLFSSGSLILQTPSSVFEGDRLVLRCKKRGRGKLTAVQYTLDEKKIYNSNKNVDLLIPQASLNHSGSYQCIGIMDKKEKVMSNKKIIRIQELFPRPTLNITALQPVEGNSVTLSCDVHLPLERQDTLLHFIFYRDNDVILSEWSRSPQFQIPSIRREDSGAYRCGVETVNNSIICKHSSQRWIHVQTDNVYSPIYSATVNVSLRGTAKSKRTAIAVGATWGLLSLLFLMLALLLYCWHKKKSGAGFPGDTASPPTPSPEEPPHPMCPATMELQQSDSNAHLKEGYTVYSEIQMVHVREEEDAANIFGTPPEDTHTSVIYSEVKKTQLPDESSGKVFSKDEDSTESS